MLLFIDVKSGVPIYDQIVQQIKDMILHGDLKPDEMLPSIRSLAKELRISVITTKRAYEELEREGCIYTVPSRGCFVAAKNIDRIREQKLTEIEEHISQIVLLAKDCGLSRKELSDMLATGLEEL